MQWFAAKWKDSRYALINHYRPATCDSSSAAAAAAACVCLPRTIKLQHQRRQEDRNLRNTDIFGGGARSSMSDKRQTQADIAETADDTGGQRVVDAWRNMTMAVR